MMKYNFTIWQVKRECQKYLFIRYSRAMKMDGGVSLDNYRKVYSGSIEVEDGVAVPVILEQLYRIFNVERPDDFYGHSLSVSDIVSLSVEDGEKGEQDLGDHFVDAIGFVHLQAEHEQCTA